MSRTRPGRLVNVLPYQNIQCGRSRVLALCRQVYTELALGLPGRVAVPVGAWQPAWTAWTLQPLQGAATVVLGALVDGEPDPSAEDSSATVMTRRPGRPLHGRRWLAALSGGGDGDAPGSAPLSLCCCRRHPRLCSLANQRPRQAAPAMARYHRCCTANLPGPPPRAAPHPVPRPPEQEQAAVSRFGLKTTFSSSSLFVLPAHVRQDSGVSPSHLAPHRAALRCAAPACVLCRVRVAAGCRAAACPGSPRVCADQRYASQLCVHVKYPWLPWRS